jgi:cytidylate kinase
MKITIGGPPGSGTTTVARRVAETLGYTYLYAGKVFRDMAAEYGMTLEEFGVRAEEDDSYDRAVDDRMRELATDDSVVEGRMSAFVVDRPDIKFWLDAPLRVRINRIVEREALSEIDAYKKTTRRQECETLRYRTYYGVDIYDLSQYDVVINTEKWDADGVYAIVMSAITNLVRATQEL